LNQLGHYRDSRGLTNEQVASELSALLGREISPVGVKAWANRKKLPKEWVQVLNLPEEPGGGREPDWMPPEQEGSASFGLPDGLDDPPMMPPESGAASSNRSPLSGGELAGARKRIAQAYNALGAGASMATRNDGYAAVTGLYSADIAEAWVEAGRENKHVAAILEWVNSGGALGNLVFAHVIMIGGFAYVAGYFHQLGPFFGGKLDRYHAAAYRRREEDAAAAEAAANGAADGAAGPVGKSGGTPPFRVGD
jgi:hypothetical protein